jgi:hypothetical protein
MNICLTRHFTYVFFLYYREKEQKKSQEKIKELKLVMIYTHFLCTPMIRLQRTYVSSKNFKSNCLHNIIIFNVFKIS